MFTVAVDWYSLEPGRIGKDIRPVIRFQHRTLKAACRRLAAILSGRSKQYRELYAEGRDFYIVTPDGREMGLRFAQHEAGITLNR